MVCVSTASDSERIRRPVSEPGAVAMGSSESQNLVGPLAIARGTDTISK